jgi:DNA polymerase-3 subunit alpha
MKTLSDLYLEYQCVIGWNSKIVNKIPKEKLPIYAERLNKELSIFSQAGISDYFLILKGIMDYCYENDIPQGAGRGSAAGCLVAYLTNITMPDPIEHDLLLERFYNPGRLETRELPDIDVDVSKLNRDKIINEYIVPTYGRDRVAPIITFGCLQPKSAIKDIGRALGLPIQETEKLSKLIDMRRGVATTIKETMAETEDGLPTKLALEMFAMEAKHSELFKWAKLIEDVNFIRTKGVHAAGIIISPEPVGDVVPLEWNAQKKIACTAYDMYNLASTGLLKLDLLGLRNTDVLQDTMKRLGFKKKYRDVLAELDMKDEYVYSRLGEGKSVGVFQLESNFMKNICCDVKPSSMEDLSTINALGRPGPLDAKIDVTDDINWEDEEAGLLPDYLRKKFKKYKQGQKLFLNMIDVFSARKNGSLRVSYLHSKLEPVLKNTYGIITYQEQVMRIATDLAGYTLAEADGLRKIMGKKLLDKIEKEEPKFIQGCVKNNIEENIAKEIWAQMKTFAAYGFNKSHSIAYSFLSYYTAYFKFRHPAEFMASLISSDKDIEQRKVWIKDARETLNLTVIPPHINKSKEDFDCVNSELVFGLSEIKGVGNKATTMILNTRSKGIFKDIKDFYKRVDLSIVDSGVMGALISAGAFDSMGNRASMLEWDNVIRSTRASNMGKHLRRQENSLKLQQEIADLTLGNTQFDIKNIAKKYHKLENPKEQYIKDLNAKLEVVNRELEEFADKNNWFVDLKPKEEMDLATLLAAEEQVLGVAISGNLADPYKIIIQMHGHDTTKDIKNEDEEGGDKKFFTICGILSGLKEHLVKNGKSKGMKMSFGKIIDLDGSIDIVIFPKQQAQFDRLIKDNQLVQAKVIRSEDRPDSVTVQGLYDIGAAYV